MTDLVQTLTTLIGQTTRLDHVEPSLINNFKHLPKPVQDAINGCDKLYFIGWQELVGRIGRSLIFSAMYHANGTNSQGFMTFIIESIGFIDAEGNHYCWTPAKGLYLYKAAPHATLKGTLKPLSEVMEKLTNEVTEIRKALNGYDNQQTELINNAISSLGDAIDNINKVIAS